MALLDAAARGVTHLADERQAGDDGMILRGDVGGGPRLPGHGQSRGEIAGAEILGERRSHQRIDGGKIEDVHNANREWKPSMLFAQDRQMPAQCRLSLAQRAGLLSLLLDDLSRRAIDEIGAVQLRLSPAELLLDLGQVALEPLSQVAGVDDAAERYEDLAEAFHHRRRFTR